MSTIDPVVDADVASVDDVGPDQPPDDGINEEHTIALDVPHPLPTTVTSGDSAHTLHTVPLDLPPSTVN